MPSIRQSILHESQLTDLHKGVRNVQHRRARLQSSCQANSPHLGQDRELCDSVAGLVAEADFTLESAKNVREDTSCYSQSLTASKSIRDDCESRYRESSVGPSDAIPATAKQVHPYQHSVASQSDASLAWAPQLPLKSVLRPPRIELDLPNGGLISPVSTTSPTKGNGSVIQWIDNVSQREIRPRQEELSSVAGAASPSVTSGRAASTVASEFRSSPSTGRRLSSGNSWTLPSISGSSHAKVETNEADDSDEDDITIDLARTIISTGQSALGRGDHQSARGCFLEALTLLQELPQKAREAACAMLDLRYDIAMCSLALDNQVEVEKSLLEVLQHEPSSDTQREKLFHVSHVLTQLYITTGRLALARQSCNNALRGRRKLLGKEHQDYYSSLALMARISELEGADIQAKAYKDMIPVAEQPRFAYNHIRMDVFCEKEVVELTDTEHRSLSSEQTVHDAALPNPTPRVGEQAHEVPSHVTEPQVLSRQESQLSLARASTQRAPSVQSSMIEPEDPRKLTTYGRFSQIPDKASGTAVLPRSLSVAYAREPASMPLPSPTNDYLGFCKAAWQLQAGDRSALKKTKQSSLSSATTYWLCCTGPKCQFATGIQTSVIRTWESVERSHARQGVVYRFPFLAKSHVRQNKLATGQALYKCMFCVLLGAHTPIIQGTEAYIDHVARRHRGSELSQVILHRIGCVNDRVCAEEEDFDINLLGAASG